MPQMTHLGININPAQDHLFDELGIARLKESYMMDNELSILPDTEQRVMVKLTYVK